MTGVGKRLLKAALSAVYWTMCFYAATGLFLGDRVGPDGIEAPGVIMPAWAFSLIAIGLYAGLSFAWDRLFRTDRE